MQSNDPSRPDYFPNSSVELDPLAPGKARRAQDRATDARRADAAHDQSIERRVRYTLPAKRGDGLQEALADRAVKKARELQSVPYAIAPGASVVSLTRGRLGPGAEISMSDVGDDHEVMNYLVRVVGCVLWVDPDSRAISPLDSTHTHIVLKAVTVPGLVLVPGSGLNAKMCSTPDESAIEAVPGSVTTTGLVLRGKAGQPARKGDPTGKSTLASLVARRLVRERDKSDSDGPQGPQAA